MASGRRSAGDETVAKPFDSPNHAWFSRRALDCFICKSEQFGGVKAGSEPLQTLCSNRPVAVTTRAFEVVQMAVQTVTEGQTQFCQQRGIFSSGCRQCRIERSVFMHHRQQA